MRKPLLIAGALLLTTTAMNLGSSSLAHAEDGSLSDFFKRLKQQITPSPTATPDAPVSAPVSSAPVVTLPTQPRPEFPLAPGPNRCAQVGPQRIAVVLANYEGSPSDAGTPNADYVRELMLGTSHDFSVSDYYKTISGGRTWFESVTVVGPYTSPRPFIANTQHIEDSLEAWESSLLTLAQNDVDFTKIDRVVFITPEAINPDGTPRAMGAGLAAQGVCDLQYSGPNGQQNLAHAWVRADNHYNQGADPHRVSNNPDSLSPDYLQKQIRQNMMLDMAPIAHELGHTFGLGHANQVNRPTTGNTATQFQNEEILPGADQTMFEVGYGDPFSEMAAGNVNWLNIAHLNYLGWLSPNQTAEVRDDGTYRIYPLEGTDASKLKGLKIPRAVQSKNEATTSFLWVEYRHGNTPYDTDLSALDRRTDGALVHYTNPKQPGPNSMWPEETVLLNFNPGNVNPYEKDLTLKGSWKDAHSLVKLEVLQVTPEYLDIKVSFAQ